MKKIKNIILIIIFLIVAVSLGMETYSLFGFSTTARMIKNPVVRSFAFMGIQFVFFLMCFFMVYVFTRFIDKTKLSDVGLAVNKKGVKIFLTGMVLAALAGVITWLVFVFMNKPMISCKINGGWAILIFMILAIPTGFFQAAGEELVFRSWALKKLGETFTPVVAIILIGLLFGGVHLLNPKYSMFAVFNACLVGVVASLSYFRTKSVWMAAGIHFGWNYTVGMLYGTILTITYNGKVINMFDGAEATLTGCLVFIAIGIIVFYITRQEKMKA